MALRMQLTIPRSHYSGFRRLEDLTPEQFDSLHQALRHAMPILPIDQLIQQISVTSEVREEDAAEIIPMVVSLHGVRDETKVPTEQFIDALIEARRRTPDEAKGTYSGDELVMRQRLTALLEDGGPLTAIAKAHTLANEYERTFLDARIVSDIRPLFAEDPTIQPNAAILVHTLKVAFFEDGERRELFVSLRTNDLRKLQGILNRAEQKAKNMESSLRSIVTILEEEGDEW